VLEYTGDGRAGLLEALREDGRGKLMIVSYALLQQDQAEARRAFVGHGGAR